MAEVDHPEVIMVIRLVARMMELIGVFGAWENLVKAERRIKVECGRPGLEIRELVAVDAWGRINRDQTGAHGKTGRKNKQSIIFHLSFLRSPSQAHTAYLYNTADSFLTTHIHLNAIKISFTHLQPPPPQPPTCAGATSASTRKTSTQTAPPYALLAPTPTAPMQAHTAGDGSDCHQECSLERQVMAVVEAMVVLGLEDLSGAAAEVIMGVGRVVCTEQAIQGFRAWDEGGEGEVYLVVEADGCGWVGEVWEAKGHREWVVVAERQRLGIGPGEVIGELSGVVGASGVR
ncbi:hypothetical protein MMC27_007545 [Xylographa pallens]|nr:hypothetical protein [Xylographa pallens]